MIKGTYIFYQDGKEIHRSENVITKFGKRFITNFIAGNINTAKKDISIGIDSTSATENDTRLGFEFYRLPVTIGSTDIQTDGLGATTYAVVYKTTLPQDIAGQINEIGLYPSLRSSTNNYDSKFISSFSDNLSWYTSTGENPTYSTTGTRIGDNVLTLSSDSGSSKTYTSDIPNIDLNGYSINDTVTFAYYKNDNNLQKIRIKFHSSPTSYLWADITPPSGLGYIISTDIPMSTFYNNEVNSPDKSSITKISIEIHPTTGNTTSIGADGWRLNDEDTFDPAFGLISRTALDNPLVKYTGRTVDVEYRLEMTF